MNNFNLNVIEHMAEHSIHYLPCSYTNDITVTAVTSYRFQSDVIGMPFRQGTQHNSWIFPSCCGSRSMLSSDLCGIGVCSSRIISAVLPEIHTVEKCDSFSNRLTDSLFIYSSSISNRRCLYVLVVPSNVTISQSD